MTVNIGIKPNLRLFARLIVDRNVPGSAILFFAGYNFYILKFPCLLTFLMNFKITFLNSPGLSMFMICPAFLIDINFDPGTTLQRWPLRVCINQNRIVPSLREWESKLCHRPSILPIRYYAFVLPEAEAFFLINGSHDLFAAQFKILS